MFRRQLQAIIPSLRAFARGRCGNREMAEDLAQEELMRALDGTTQRKLCIRRIMIADGA